MQGMSSGIEKNSLYKKKNQESEKDLKDHLQDTYNSIDKNLFKNVFQRRSSKVIFSSPLTNTKRGKAEKCYFTKWILKIAYSCQLNSEPISMMTVTAKMKMRQ